LTTASIKHEIPLPGMFLSLLPYRSKANTTNLAYNEVRLHGGKWRLNNSETHKNGKVVPVLS
jgi:hypothetical protein